MINSGDGNALYQIQQLVRSFQTRNLQSDKTVRIKTHAPAPVRNIQGYYILINPRIQADDYLGRIIHLQHIWGKDQFVFNSSFFGGNVETYEAINDHQFISQQTGKISMVTAMDPVAGEVLQADTQVLRRVSPVAAFGKLVLLGLWICYLIGSFIFGSIWLVRYAAGKTGGLSYKTPGLWPVLASVLFIGASVLAFYGVNDPFELLGKISIVSVSVMVLTICFALAAGWSVVTILLRGKKMLHGYKNRHILILTTLHVIVACYLLANGVIGIQTWN